MKTDVIIIGGGLVGLTMACALGKAGVKATLIEAKDPTLTNDDKFDGRCSAVAHSSANIFKAIGVWKALEKYAGPIKEIYVTDGNSPLFLHFGEEETEGKPMGYMVENRYIRRALFTQAQDDENIELLAPAEYKEIEYGNHFVTVTLKNKKKIQAKLLIAADGRNSRLREETGIEAVHHDYNQTGIVCAFKHEIDHNCIAQERFLPAGPFAILPMADCRHSALVWTERRELARELMEMNEKEFTREAEKRFGDFLGKLKLASPRWSYPLSLTFARKYSAKRMCLLGDSAHAIHPIAGQGLNLSWRDVAVLAELIVETKRLGLDIGGAGVLDAYQALRRKDNLAMIAATDSLNRLFSNNITPVRIVRKSGLALVNMIPGLKKRFVSHAMGKGEKIAKLARGEKL